jgi:uncharacterized protein
MAAFPVDQFKPVTLADQARIRALLVGQDVFLCDYNFVNLYIWGDVFNTSWLEADGRLWIYNAVDDLLLMPIGEGVRPAELQAASAAMKASGKCGSIALVDCDFVRQNDELGQYFSFTPDEANADYLYLTHRLVELKGNKLQKKKNLINQFQNQYPHYRTEPLTPLDRKICLALEEKWRHAKPSDEKVSYWREFNALERAFAAFDELGLAGIKIMLDRELAAYAMYSRQNLQSADIHFEKYNAALKGVAQVINWETARLLAGEYKYLNREQDLGIPGLRQAKRSYSPECILTTCFLQPRV